MKKTPTILLIAVSALCAVVVLNCLQAQPAAPVAKAAPTRVAICDVVEVFNTCKRTKALHAEFEARSKETRDKAEARGKQIENAQKGLIDDFKQGTPLYEKEVNRIQEEIIKLRVWEEVQAATMKRDRYVLTLALHRNILNAIKAEAKLRGIDLVVHDTTPPASDPSIRELFERIHSQTVLYYREELDLTATVLKRIDDAK